MNRHEYRSIAQARLIDAQVLLRARRYGGAYYLAGYAVEGALKACIARQFQRADIPDARLVSNIYTHDLARLLRLAELDQALAQAGRRDRQLELSWSTVLTWSETARYDTQRSRAEAEDLLRAIADRDHGVFPWLRQFW